MQVPEHATLAKVRVTFSMPTPGVEFVPAETTLTIAAPAKKKTGNASK